VNLAVANNIELLCLPAHTSSILQPLDVGVFKTVKAAWRKCIRCFYDKTRYCNVDKRQFPILLKKLVDDGAFSRINAISGFESCGIYPLNRAKITADKIATSVPLTQAASNEAACSASCTNESSANGSASSVCPSTPVLTPRKGLEVALLSHLRRVTPIANPEKRVRVKRTLAESLTSEESRKRLEEADRIKEAKTQRKEKTKQCNDEFTAKRQRLSHTSVSKVKQIDVCDISDIEPAVDSTRHTMPKKTSHRGSKNECSVNKLNKQPTKTTRAKSNKVKKGSLHVQHSDTPTTQLAIRMPVRFAAKNPVLPLFETAEAVINPVVPLLESTEPGINPVVPVLETIEPVVPVLESTELGINPVVPVLETTEPVVPVFEPTEPGINPVVPVLETTEPVVPVLEPTEPGINPVVPVLEPTEPGINSVVPVLETTEPVVPVIETSKTAANMVRTDTAEQRLSEAKAIWS